MSQLIRYRYNTMAASSPGGDWQWRVILERDGAFEEILARRLVINVPSFSQEDEMPIVGRKYHMACHGAFRLDDAGTGFVEPC